MSRIKQPGKRWGIVVGVDEYQNADEYLHNLQGCVVDAHKMYDTMMNGDCGGFLEDHVQLLENPCYDELEEAFATVGRQMCAGDEFWFYFAGHGYSDKQCPKDNGYLLLSGAKYDMRGFLRDSGSLSKYQLERLLGKHISAGGVTVVCFLDCCCAASVGLNTGDRAVRETTELDDMATSFRDLSCGAGDDDAEPMRFLSICATGKYGRASEDRNGGAFTKRLVQGLMGGTTDHPTAFEDIYVTAGALGDYIGAKMSSQGPKQNISDPTYPLSVSPAKKKAKEQIDRLNSNVNAWLAGVRGCCADRQFAERVMLREKTDEFEFAGVMRNVLRLVSDPKCAMKVQGEDAANLLKAFHVLKKLLDRVSPEELAASGVAVAESPSVRKPVPRSHAAGLSSAKTPLTHQDRELLADVEDRVREIDGDKVDLGEAGRRSQPDAAAALNAMARKRMRQMCEQSRFVPLYTKTERDAWSVKAKNGFSSPLEAAVYELVKDDKAIVAGKR